MLAVLCHVSPKIISPFLKRLVAVTTLDLQLPVHCLEMALKLARFREGTVTLFTVMFLVVASLVLTGKRQRAVHTCRIQNTYFSLLWDANVLPLHKSQRNSFLVDGLLDRPVEKSSSPKKSRGS